MNTTYTVKLIQKGLFVNSTCNTAAETTLVMKLKNRLLRAFVASEHAGLADAISEVGHCPVSGGRKVIMPEMCYNFSTLIFQGRKWHQFDKI